MNTCAGNTPTTTTNGDYQMNNIDYLVSAQNLIKGYIERHGFNAFINPDNYSVSFWLPYVDCNELADGEDLITVSSLGQARIELGY
jgi:hypothetical protein